MTHQNWGLAPPGFRLPADAHVGPVHLQVTDLQRSIDYYGAVLGLRVQEAAGDTAALAPQGEDRTLLRLRGTASRPARRGAYGLYHFAMLLPDRAALGRFAAHLAARAIRVGMADHLVSEALYLWDPDGLGIEVYADRPRSAWRHHDRELAMTTDPLDIDDLLGAGGGHTWDGMPAGSTIGHVHLHVGSLPRAEAFYHAALGLDKVVWSYPGALFLSAGGYHHHLGTNTWSSGPAAAEDEARLLAWELVVPHADDAAAAAASLRAGGHPADRAGGGWSARDPWGTQVAIVPGA